MPEPTRHAWLDGGAPARIAAATSLLVGLFFIFVRAPHPWGWHGIDQYHDLALALARGEGFPTTDVPWGYTYFLAVFYRLFGDHPWIPLVVQAALNALTPALTYQLVRDLVDRRTAAIAALITGVFSFNTVYASTQSSDSVCTVLFLFGVLCAARAEAGRGLKYVMLAGLAFGASAQFRPNLILFPAVWAGWSAWRSPRPRRRWLEAAVLIAISTAVDIPWVVRNYRITNQFIPTSTHGAIQLWYGALQSGPYLTSRARNPASAFETPAFDYSALADTPIRVWADVRECTVPPPEAMAVVYWTDRVRIRRRIDGIRQTPRRLGFDIPGQPLETTVYYFFDGIRESTSQTTPAGGTADPLVFFVSDRHTSDLDRHNDLLDAFDVIRLVRYLAWSEPVGTAPLDLDHDGRVTPHDLRLAVSALLDEARQPDRFQTVDRTAERATLRLTDGSAFEVPRRWSGRITDVTVHGALAAKLVYAHRSFAGLHEPRLPYDRMCLQPEEFGVNDLFSRREPQQMRRYSALALDYIERHPIAFALASLFRMVRVFVVVPTDDPWATYQFRGSRAIYGAAMAASFVYFGLFVVGVVRAAQSHALRWQLLLPVVYIPATLCYVLTNMRYTVTMQPFVFAFVAIAIGASISSRSNPARHP